MYWLSFVQGNINSVISQMHFILTAGVRSISCCGSPCQLFGFLQYCTFNGILLLSHLPPLPSDPLLYLSRHTYSLLPICRYEYVILPHPSFCLNRVQRSWTCAKDKLSAVLVYLCSSAVLKMQHPLLLLANTACALASRVANENISSHPNIFVHLYPWSQTHCLC